MARPAGARSTLSGTEQLAYEGSVFSWEGVTFDAQGMIGGEVDFNDPDFLMTVLDGGTTVYREPGADHVVIQTDKEGLAVKFENGVWFSHLEATKFEEPPPVETDEKPEPPKPCGLVYSRLRLGDFPNIEPLDHGRIKIFNHYIPRDVAVDFIDPISNAMIWRDGRFLFVSTGVVTHRFLNTGASWRVLIGEPWRWWYSVTPAYVPYKASVVERIMSHLDSTTAKTIAIWALPICALVSPTLLIFHVIGLFNWRPSTLPKRLRPRLSEAFGTTPQP